MSGEGRVLACKLIYNLLITVGVKMRLVFKLPLAQRLRSIQQAVSASFLLCIHTSFNHESSQFYASGHWRLISAPLKLTISVQKLTWRCCTSWFSALLLWVWVALIFILLKCVHIYEDFQQCLQSLSVSVDSIFVDFCFWGNQRS